LGRGGGRGEGGGEAYFYLKEILRRAIYLLEALLARIGHCLHGCGWGSKVARKILLAL
jgi:hypothetical protein